MALASENIEKSLFRKKLIRSRNTSLQNTYHTQFTSSSNNQLTYNDHKNISENVGFIFTKMDNINTRTEMSINKDINKAKKIISDSVSITNSPNKHLLSKKKLLLKNSCTNTLEESLNKDNIFFKNSKSKSNKKTEFPFKNERYNNTKNYFYSARNSFPKAKTVVKLLKKDKNDKNMPEFLFKSDSQLVFNKTFSKKIFSNIIDEDKNAITERKLLTKKLLKNINDSSILQKKIFKKRNSTDFKQLKKIYETSINDNISQVKNKIIDIFTDYDSLMKKSYKSKDNLNNVNKQFCSYSLNSINNMANSLNSYQNLIKDDLFKILDVNNLKIKKYKHKKKKIDPIFELVFDRELKKEKNIKKRENYKSAIQAEDNLQKDELQKNKLMRLSEIITNLNTDVALDLANNVLKYNEKIRKSLGVENIFTQKLRKIRNLAAIAEINKRNILFQKGLSYLKYKSDESRELKSKIINRLKNYEEKIKKEKIKNDIKNFFYKQKINDDKSKLVLCIKKYNIIK